MTCLKDTRFFLKRKFKLMVISSYKRNTHLSSSLNTKETTTYDAGNIGLDLGQAQQCSRVTPVNGTPMLPSWKQDFLSHYIYKRTIKNLHRFASTQKNPQTITKMNDNINMNLFPPVIIWAIHTYNIYIKMAFKVVLNNNNLQQTSG